MKPITDIHELHSIILQIGKTFHKICQENNIPYYMLGGTLLGAIRHKGFIPWDDDMDFGIPRKHYFHALDILRKQLPPEYKVVTIEDGVGIFGEIAKVEDTRTVINEMGRDVTGKTAGVFIDIFPIDETNDNYGRFSRNMLILRLLHAQQLVMSNSKHPGHAEKLCKFTSKLLGRYFFLRLLRAVVRKSGTHNTNYSGMWDRRETVKKEIIGKPKLYDFEDTQFYGVNKPHEYLTSLYDDYMQLPPEDKRHTHLENVYYK